MTLVIYDISDDHDRLKLSELLRDFGLSRIQYSGFKGELNRHDLDILARKIESYVKGAKDSVYLLPLCNRCVRLCRIVSIKEVRLIEDSVVKIV